MPVNADLGELILRLNPYSNNQHLVRGLLTGPADIYTGRPTLPPGGPAPAGTINQLGGQEPTGTIADVELEMESNYPAEWAFKGEPQKVYKTVRLKYRYPVLEPPPPPPAPPPAPNILYWIEDYILIGFEGGPA